MSIKNTTFTKATSKTKEEIDHKYDKLILEKKQRELAEIERHIAEIYLKKQHKPTMSPQPQPIHRQLQKSKIRIICGETINVSCYPHPDILRANVYDYGCWYCGKPRCCLTHKYSPRGGAKFPNRNPYLQFLNYLFIIFCCSFN